MKLAFCLFKYFLYGGLERDCLRIADVCLQNGHSIDVFTVVWQGDIPLNINVHLIAVSGLTNHAKNRAYTAELRERLAGGAYDAVVGFNKMPGLDLYYAADPCYLAQAYEVKPWLYRLTGRFRHFAAYEKAVFGVDSGTELMMISAVEQEKFKRYYNTPEKHFHLLPPGISRDRVAPENAAEIRQKWRRELRLEDESLALLMVGSAFKRKGLDRAIIALAALSENLRRLTKLIVVGEDDPEPYRRLARKYGVMGNIEFFLGRDDVPRFLLGADFFLHPAYSENTGTVILEAVVAGLPVLVTDVCGYAFHVDKAGAGRVLSSPFRQDEMNRALAEMLVSGQRDQWRKNALAYAKQEDLYSMPEVAGTLIEKVAHVKKDRN